MKLALRPSLLDRALVTVFGLEISAIEAGGATLAADPAGSGALMTAVRVAVKAGATAETTTPGTAIHTGMTKLIISGALLVIR